MSVYCSCRKQVTVCVYSFAENIFAEYQDRVKSSFFGIGPGDLIKCQSYGFLDWVLNFHWLQTFYIKSRNTEVRFA